MKKILVLIMTLAVFFGCTKENDTAYLQLNFRNETGSDLKALQVFFVENNISPHDTLTFDLALNEEKNLTYKYKPGGGEGSYTLKLGEKERTFGYYPLTLSKDRNVFYFKIQKDTVFAEIRPNDW